MGEVARRRRKVKLEKVRKGKSLYILGKDATFEMVINLMTHTLLGKFEYIKMERV